MDKRKKVELHRQQEQDNHTLHHRVHEWKEGCFKSPIKRMTCGAQRIARSMSWAHKDNWRRKEVKK